MTVAAGGFVAVILILTLGIVVTIHRLDTVADRNIAEIARNEREEGLAERLRQHWLQVTAVERRLLLTRAPDALERLHAAESDFDEAFAAIRELPFEARDQSLVEEIGRTSEKLRRLEHELLADLSGTSDRDLIARFETSVIPAQRELLALLDRLVETQTQENTEAYAAAGAERDRATRELAWVVVLALVLSSLVGWTITQHLERISRRERDALAVAREATAARDDVMAVVAHDLRNPLGAIVLEAELLANTAPSDAVRSHAASIATIAMRTEYLVKAMLEVGAIEERRLELVRSRCTVGELVASTVQLFRDAAAAKGIALDVRVPSREVELDVDRDHVLQALAILVGNAIRFAPSGTAIAIAASSDPDHVKLSVADRGPAISRETLPRLFERLSTTDYRTQDGAGLGLFVAKAIAEAHAGRIWAESAPGQGATFNISLPLGPPH